MRTGEIVRSLKYDAIPRTIVPIEQFNSEIAITFDTTQATESQHANCAACAVMVRAGRAMTAWRPCRRCPVDS